jgi:hypothetical protein
MKNYAWLVIGCGLTLTFGSAPAQERGVRSLSTAQLQTVVRTDANLCNNKRSLAGPAGIIPLRNARAVAPDRVSKTLHGIWRGEVTGAYPKQFLARDGKLNVDYYWIIDTQKNEALIVEQLTSARSLPETRSANAPRFSFLMCGEEGYVPAHPRQVHTFIKISDNVEDASTLLSKSTGLRTAAAPGQFSLADAWRSLVTERYFTRATFPAYAGGYFRPFQISTVPNTIGPALIELKYEAEYRGSGATAAQFRSDEPIRGVESAQFMGVSAPGGDFLVSSFGNGKVWKKEASQGGAIELAFDKVVIGPLQ